MSVRFFYSKAQFMFNMSLLLSWVDELSIVESPLVLLHYCLLFPSCMLVFAYSLGAPMSSTYIFTTILSSWWINTFIIKQLPCVYYSSSLKVSFMWHKCSLSPGGVKMKWVLHVVPQKGSWWLVLLSLSQKQGLSNWGIPSWCWATLARGMGWCRQNGTILPSHFVQLFSDFLFLSFSLPPSCWYFVSGFQSSLEAVFVHR